MDTTEITDEEIDRLIAEVTEECTDDANDFDVLPEIADVIAAVGVSKTKPSDAPTIPAKDENTSGSESSHDKAKPPESHGLDGGKIKVEESSHKSPSSDAGKTKGEEIKSKSPISDAGKAKGEETTPKSPSSDAGKAKEETKSKSPSSDGGKAKGDETKSKSPSSDAGKAKGDETKPKSPSSDAGKAKGNETKPKSPSSDAAKAKGEEIKPKSPSSDGGETKGEETEPKSPISAKTEETKPKSPSSDAGKTKGEETKPKSPSSDGGKTKGEETKAKSPSSDGGKTKGEEIKAKSPSSTTGKETKPKASGSAKVEEPKPKSPSSDGGGKTKVEGSKPASVKNIEQGAKPVDTLTAAGDKKSGKVTGKPQDTKGTGIKKTEKTTSGVATKVSSEKSGEMKSEPSSEKARKTDGVKDTKATAAEVSGAQLQEKKQEEKTGNDSLTLGNTKPGSVVKDDAKGAVAMDTGDVKEKIAVDTAPVAVTMSMSRESHPELFPSASAPEAVLESPAADVKREIDESSPSRQVVEGSQAEDASKSTDKKKGGWGWGNIGSWGSSMLNQVGDKVFQVLETVESSLVEPEEGVPTSGDGASKELDECVAAGDVVEIQPQTAIEATEENSFGSTDESVLSLDAEKPAAADSGGTKGKKKKEKSIKWADSVEDAEGDKSKKKGKGQGSHEQSWFSGWGMSTLTAVQQTGRKVVSTGLDMLENISKKTMSVLADDPEETVAPLSPSSASAPSSSTKKKKKSKGDEKAKMLRKCFDDCQGLAHFDALSELSKASEEKLAKHLEKFSGDRLTAVKADLTLIKDASDLGGMDWETNFGNTEHSFCQLVKDFVTQLGFSVNLQKLFNTQETASKWLTECLRDNATDKKYSAEDIHKMAVLMLADFTATGIANFHKIAQLLLVDFSTPWMSYKFRALSLAGLTKVLCTEIWIQARLFTECLHQPGFTESAEAVMSLITNLTLEASNCSSCLQDGYHMLLPVIQLAALKVHPLTSDNSDIPNLEVLQMMAGMSETKVKKILNQLLGDAQRTVKADLSAVEASFDQSFLGTDAAEETEQNFSKSILESLIQIEVDISAQKLLQTRERTHIWFASCEEAEKDSAQNPANDIHQKAIQSLHELTLCSVELFHQIAQVILLENPREISMYSQRASGVKELARVLCLEVGSQSKKFTDCLSAVSKASLTDSALSPTEPSKDTITPFLTNVYLEASNSTTYIQDGFQLLLPIMQLALVKAHPACVGLSF